MHRKGRRAGQQGADLAASQTKPAVRAAVASELPPQPNQSPTSPKAGVGVSHSTKGQVL